MEDKKPIITRLNRIEGQIRGLRRMVEEDQFCGDILNQVSAVRAALNSTAGLILENYMKSCLIENSSEEELDELLEIMLQYTK